MISWRSFKQPLILMEGSQRLKKPTAWSSPSLFGWMIWIVHVFNAYLWVITPWAEWIFVFYILLCYVYKTSFGLIHSPDSLRGSWWGRQSGWVFPLVAWHHPHIDREAGVKSLWFPDECPHAYILFACFSVSKWSVFFHGSVSKSPGFGSQIKYQASKWILYYFYSHQLEISEFLYF